MQFRHSAPAGRMLSDDNLHMETDTKSVTSVTEVPMTSFYRIYVRRSHTVTILCAASIGILIFEYLNRTIYHYDNVITGLLAVIFMFVTFAICCFPDDVFIRPCTAFWRAILGITVMYLCLVVFCCFQDINDIRAWMTHFDSSLGVPPVEKSYAENCTLFDASHPKGRLGPLIDSMDFFVLAHSLGWAGKFLVLRDWTLCWICSIGFEFCELTFRYILPNFWECWWDHLLLDLFGCNFLGMIGGWLIIKQFDLKRYDNWRCVNSEEDILNPVSGFKAAFADVETWTCWLFVIFSCLAFDVNYFFVKAILWLEPDHWMVFCRGVPLAAAACHATRQAYDYINNPQRRTIGVQLWIFLATLISEFVFIHKNFITLSEFMPGQQLDEQPLYSKIIAGSFFGLAIIGYFIAAINQYRRAHATKYKTQ